MDRPFVSFHAEQSHRDFIEKGKALLDSLGARGTMSFTDRIEAAKACAMLAEACKNEASMTGLKNGF